MLAASTTPAFRVSRGATFKHHGEGATDGQLLERFAASRDEAAFAVLVQRYGPLVLGVCRRKLQHEQDAEDAFQATFLVLARKAGTIARWDLLGNWLYGVACRTAAKARLREVKRRLREQPLPDQPLPDDAAPPTFNDLRPILDEEVERLPLKYRTPFVLCYLEGKTNEEAADRLGCPRGTVQSRLSWARARLRSRLQRRGVSLHNEMPLMALVGEASRAGLRASLAPSAVQAAIQFTCQAGRRTAVSAPAVLAQGVLRTMFLTKVAVAGVVTFSLVLFGAGAGMVGLRALADTTAAARDDDAPRNATIDKKENAHTSAGSGTWNGHAIVTEKEAVSKSFNTGSAPRVIVEVFSGPIKVVGAGKNAVDVAITKQGGGLTAEEAKEALKKVHVETRQEGDTVRVTARLDHEEHQHLINTSASAVLTVPSHAALDLHTDFGSISTQGVTGDQHADSTSGTITAQGTKGSLRLGSQFGSIEIDGDSPHIEARTTSGNIRYQGGKAERLDLHSEFGMLEVSGQTTNVDAHATSGDIRIRDGRGTLNLKTDFGSIDVRGTDVRLNAETSSGSVQFTGTLANGDNSCVSHFGSVTVRLPATTAFDVDATTSFGTVHNDFKLTASAERKRQHVRGTVGDHPAIHLRLHTDSGGIDIRRQR